MAYGKNKERKDWLMRAIPLGIGSLTRAKRDSLLSLRGEILALMRQMASCAFSPEPLKDCGGSKALDARLLEVQKAYDSLNSVWREQARMRVKFAIEECDKRYFKRLVGRLCYLDQEIPEADRREESKRRYYHIPEQAQDSIKPEEIGALKTLGTSGKAIDLFGQVILHNVNSFEGIALSECQITILKDIHQRSLAKHTVPDFGAKEDFTLQLHIDARMLPAGRAAEAIELRNGVSFLLEDEKNALYCRFLDIAGIAPRAERIRIPLVLTRKIAHRMESSRSEWASLIVEISEKATNVRLVVGKPKPEINPQAIHAIVGRDFGYANTVSLSVAVSDFPIELPTADIREQSKEEAEAFFKSHALPDDVRIVERVRFEGRSFLNRINTHCERIDAYKSRIDLSYNRLSECKKKIVQDLGLKEGELITPEMKQSSVGDKVREFFKTFGLIQDLKKARRVLYRKIAQIKKAWFGFLSNVEITMARKHQAAIVREDLTVLAIEKDAPEYKGRTFNKMLNYGSKGQYQRRATDNLQWNGIPEVVIPSWFTSRACTRHSIIVEPKHRKGDTIHLPCCGRQEHADEHAGDTIANYLFLRPRLTGGPCVSPVCDTSMPRACALGSTGL